MTAAAILLAAGESTRMGSAKALLPWRGAALIEYQVRALLTGGYREIVVVLGHEADEIRPFVPPEAQIVVNEGYHEGRASSLQAGAAALPDDADPIVILNVDQPRPSTLLAELRIAHGNSDALITLPSFEGKHGHPPVLSGSLLPELRDVSDETQGLLAVIDAHRDALQEYSVSSPIVLLDLNTPDQYERALAAFDGDS